MELLNVFKFSVSWLTNKDSQKLYALLIVVKLLATVLSIIGIVLALLSLFMPAIASSSAEAASFLNQFALLTGLGIGGIIFGTLLFLLAVLAPGYFEALTMFSALKAKGFKSVKWTVGKYVNYLLLGIVHFIYAFFSLLNRPYRPIVAGFYASLFALIGVFIVLTGGTAIVPAWALTILLVYLILLVGLFGTAYIVLFVYNGIRQIMCFPLFLESEMGKRAAIRASWELTRGRALDVFVASFVISLFWGLSLIHI